MSNNEQDRTIVLCLTYKTFGTVDNAKTSINRVVKLLSVMLQSDVKISDSSISGDEKE